jgi:acyl carrier protein
MNQEEIIERLRNMMKQSSQEPVDWETVTGDTAIDSLGFDSLSMLDLIYDVQQEFGTDFDAEEMVTVNTVGELAAFLGQKGV